MMNHFELTSEQKILFEDFKKSVELEYGECGLFLYKFEMTRKDCPVEIYSVLSGKSIILKDSREI